MPLHSTDNVKGVSQLSLLPEPGDNNSCRGSARSSVSGCSEIHPGTNCGWREDEAHDDADNGSVDWAKLFRGQETSGLDDDKQSSSFDDTEYHDDAINSYDQVSLEANCALHRMGRKKLVAMRSCIRSSCMDEGAEAKTDKEA